MMQADEVARIGYRAMKRGKPSVVAGWVNKIAVSVARAMPTRVMVKISATLNKSDGET